jgi:histidine ammonia-lyase
MGTRYGVIHHGAFLETALAHELDGMALSLAQEVPLVLGRVTMLNDGRHTGLPRFLAPRQAGTSGTMIVEYVAASAAGEVYAAVSPVSAYSAVLSNGLEEDATYATTSAMKLQRAVDAFETMVACELLECLKLSARAISAVRIRNFPEVVHLPKPLL